MVIKRVKNQADCSWKFHSVSLHSAANCASPWFQTNGTTALEISQLNTWQGQCHRRARMAGEPGELEHPGRAAILRHGRFPASGDAPLAAAPDSPPGSRGTPLSFLPAPAPGEHPGSGHYLRLSAEPSRVFSHSRNLTAWKFLLSIIWGHR